MDAPLIGSFAAAMAAAEPFGPRPRLAVAVSGGADSMALALLARDWAQARGGTLLALVVDHGLRPESGAEAALTLSRLAAMGIPARGLRLSGLRRGSGLAARARAARYEALATACAEAEITDLLLGHHAADQAETLMLRVLSSSGGRGLAGMPLVRDQPGLRLLRPLLTVPPARLRAALRAAGVAWVEDPSNADRRAARPRLRLLRDDPAGEGAGTQALVAAARWAGHDRAARDATLAALLAERVSMRPEGFAILTPGALPPDALAALIRVIGGAAFPPGLDQVAALAADPRPATLGGVRLLPAGRLGPGLLVVREAAAIGPDVPLRDGVIWDGRFAVRVTDDRANGLHVGAVGADAARLRRVSRLPAAVLRTLPALRCGNLLVAVPHLFYPDATAGVGARVVFCPSQPLAGAAFLPA